MGQIGFQELTPEPVTGGLSFASVSAGSGHACGVTVGGDAYCWGSNARGQLGDGSMLDRSTPMLVEGGLKFTSVSAGSSDTCGITTSGDAHCWGRNDRGQLGDGTRDDRLAPVLVAGGLTFALVSAGGFHTCGVTTSDDAYCWGANSIGQIGNPPPPAGDRLTPSLVTGGLTFVLITVGSNGHTCGVTTLGGGFCWGLNNEGQLGNGTKINGPHQPGPVEGSLSFAILNAGIRYTCGVTTSGDAYCWGENFSGQLGNGTTIGRLTPVLVAGVPEVP